MASSTPLTLSPSSRLRGSREHPGWFLVDLKFLNKVAEEDISEAMFAGILVFLATLILGYVIFTT